MKRILKLLIITLLVAAITGGILTYIHTSQEQAAKQACLDYIADQASKGTPIPHQDLLDLWSGNEGKNLYAEPTIFEYLTTHQLNSPEDDDDPVLIAAVDRFTKGMVDCETISLVPVVKANIGSDNALYRSAAASKSLYDLAMERVKTLAEDGNFNEAIRILQNLHEMEAQRSDHVLGLLDLTVQVLEKLTLIGATQEILASAGPNLDVKQLDQLLGATKNWNVLKGLGNIFLFERAYQYLSFENLEDSSDINPWKLHLKFRYSETNYEAQLILWKALEDASNASGSGWNIDTAEHSINVVDASTSGFSAPNPFLKDEFETITKTFNDTRPLIEGLKTSILSISAHELLLACHHQKISTGNFPETIDDIPVELLPPDRLSLLKSANATLRVENDKIFVDYDLPDGTMKIMPETKN